MPGATEEKVIEAISEVLHDIWMDWSWNIVQEENISDTRVKRWKSLWVHYNSLPENEKEKDKKLARKIIKAVGRVSDE